MISHIQSQNNRNLQELGAGCPVVKVQALAAEQASYSLAWCELVNPEGKVFSTLYSGIGADFSTVLLSTNSTLVVGTELTSLSLATFSERMADWDTIDQPLADKIDVREILHQQLVRAAKGDPIFSNPEIIEIKLQQAWQLAEENPQLIDQIREGYIAGYQKIYSSRYQTGYYAIEGYGLYGLETYLIMELRAMGVDPESVNLSEQENSLIIKFPWRHPFDSAVKEREFRLLHSRYTKQVFEQLPSSELPKFDCYYEKSNDRPMYISDYDALAAQLVPGASLLIGQQLIAAINNPAELLPKLFWFSPDMIMETMQTFEVDDSYSSALAKHFEQYAGVVSNAPEYGWKLRGLRFHS